jgi:hypothetical protein
MTPEPPKNKPPEKIPAWQTMLGCVGSAVFCVGGLVLFSLGLDWFDHATRGSWIESTLNLLSNLYQWLAIGVALIIVVGIVAGACRRA